MTDQENIRYNAAWERLDEAVWQLVYITCGEDEDGDAHREILDAVLDRLEEAEADVRASRGNAVANAFRAAIEGEAK